MKKWIRNYTLDTFTDGERTLSYEEYELYRGKYTTPTDELLDSICYILEFARLSPQKEGKQ